MSVEIFNNGKCIVDYVEGTIIAGRLAIKNKEIFIQEKNTKQEFCIHLNGWDIPLRKGHILKIFRCLKKGYKDGREMWVFDCPCIEHISLGKIFTNPQGAKKIIDDYTIIDDTYTSTKIAVSSMVSLILFIILYVSNILGGAIGGIIIFINTILFCVSLFWSTIRTAPIYKQAKKEIKEAIKQHLHNNYNFDFFIR